MCMEKSRWIRKKAVTMALLFPLCKSHGSRALSSRSDGDKNNDDDDAFLLGAKTQLQMGSGQNKARKGQATTYCALSA